MNIKEKSGKKYKSPNKRYDKTNQSSPKNTENSPIKESRLRNINE